MLEIPILSHASPQAFDIFKTNHTLKKAACSKTIIKVLLTISRGIRISAGSYYVIQNQRQGQN